VEHLSRQLKLNPSVMFWTSVRGVLKRMSRLQLVTKHKKSLVYKSLLYISLYINIFRLYQLLLY